MVVPSSKKKRNKKRRAVNARKSDAGESPAKRLRSEPCLALYPVNVIESQVAAGDFHMHSKCSDGKYTPRQVVEMAAVNGVQALSLTDHDSMMGVSEAIETGKEFNVLVIPGSEISVGATGEEHIHILAYFAPGTENKQLIDQLEQLRESRHARGKKMLEKLATFGIKLEWTRILEIAGEAAPGRPHVAQALVEGKHVKNFRQAFSLFLGNNGPAYVEGKHFPPEEAIQLIRDAGGISVLAHPWCCKNPLTLVPKLAKAGLDGLEVYHNTNKIDMYRSLAEESSLIMTGGSDFHGISPETERYPGDIPFTLESCEAFLEFAKTKWKAPLLVSLAERVAKLNQGSDVETICIWKEQRDVLDEFLESKNDIVSTIVVQDPYLSIQLSRKPLQNE